MQLSRDDLKRAYRSMFTIRTFEERVTKEFAQGNIPGFAHVYIGQEASAVGRLLRPDVGGLHRLDPPRPWPLHRQGLRRPGHDAGDHGQAGRPLRRQGRLHAHRRHVQGHAGRQRHRRRRAADRGRRGADPEAQADRQGGGGVHRRRRLQPGHHLRGPEHGRGAEGAGHLRFREQRLRRAHRDQLRRRGALHRRARRELRPARRGGRRHADFFAVHEAMGRALEHGRAGEGPYALETRLLALPRPLRRRSAGATGCPRSWPQARANDRPAPLPHRRHRGAACWTDADARRHRARGGRRGRGRGPGWRSPPPRPDPARPSTRDVYKSSEG